MNEGFPLLSLTTFLPLIGAAIILTVRGEEKHVSSNSRHIALYTSIITFALSLIMMWKFQPDKPGFQFAEHRDWFPQFHISYAMGVDGISLFFIVLSAFLTPLCIWASWESVTKRVREYMVAF